jgi:D-alanyl-D-alanine carboxypeptidase/D-alanyl-D-alanine-endopeptidase (penicillin-binding protein 4)
MKKHRRGASAFVLTAAAAVCAVLAFGGQGTTRSSAVPSLVTPLWSIRRFPEPVVTDAERSIDGRELSGALNAYVSWFGDACYVVSGPDGLFVARNPDEPMLPASTEKLLTATAALRVLGPDYQFTTVAAAASPPVDGAVDHLWIVGGGDPELATAPYAEPGVTTPLEALADSIVTAGVTRVTNGVLVDDSRYDLQRYVPTWKDTYRTQFESGPIGALTVNHGIPLVQGRPVTVDDPGLYTAGELVALLRARGVAVGPQIGRSGVPGDAVTVGSVQSQPLRTIIAAMLQTSDNLVAESLTKELGVRAASEGTTAAGTSVTMSQLAALGVPLGGVTMLDGSGLDRGDRLTCRTLADVVDLSETPPLAALNALLPTAGAGTAVAGMLHAKGGYLDDVIGLAGVLNTTRTLAFAFLINGPLGPNPGAQTIGFATTLAAVPAAQAGSIVPAVEAPRPATTAARNRAHAGV